MLAIGLGHTDKGKQRGHNEDAYLVDNDLGLYIVSDGMGGHAAGEVASATAVDSVVRVIREHRATIDRVRRRNAELGDLRAIVEKAVQTACYDVYHLARTSTGRAGMGATLTMILVVGDSAVMAHVGDSKLYLYRRGAVHQVSSDHTMISELLRAGAMTSAEAKTNPYAHVLTRSVGTREAVVVDTLVFDLIPDDRLMLCSDGLSDFIDDMEWLALKLGDEDFDAIPESLIGYANEMGGHDNITSVVVRVDSEPEEEAAEARAEAVQSAMGALGSVFLFEDLPLAHLTRVLQACELRELPEGTVLVREAGACDRLIVVVEGALSLTRGDREVGQLGPGKHMGATSLLDVCSARFTVRAKEPTKLLVLQQAPFWKLLQSRPWLGLSLLERLARLLSRDRLRLIESLENGDEIRDSILPSDFI